MKTRLVECLRGFGGLWFGSYCRQHSCIYSSSYRGKT